MMPAVCQSHNSVSAQRSDSSANWTFTVVYLTRQRDTKDQWDPQKNPVFFTSLARVSVFAEPQYFMHVGSWPGSCAWLVGLSLRSLATAHGESILWHVVVHFIYPWVASASAHPLREQWVRHYSQTFIVFGLPLDQFTCHEPRPSIRAISQP